MTRPFLADRIAGNVQRLAAGETNHDPGETNHDPDPGYSSGRQHLAHRLPRCHLIAAQ
jgi:hypothetical protein